MDKEINNALRKDEKEPKGHINAYSSPLIGQKGKTEEEEKERGEKNGCDFLYS